MNSCCIESYTRIEMGKKDNNNAKEIQLKIEDTTVYFLLVCKWYMMDALHREQIGRFAEIWIENYKFIKNKLNYTMSTC